MNNCEYCKKEVDRPVFCSTNHRVYYHRYKKMARQTPDDVEKESQKVVLNTGHKAFNTTPCPIHHGFKGTCGCK